MLIHWGCEIAQKQGVLTYLEASPAGLPVYKKAGFQPVGEFVFDLEKYGGVGSRVNVQMIKLPENTLYSAAEVNMQNDRQVRA